MHDINIAVDVLLHEYQDRRNEIIVFTQRNHKQYNYFYIYTSVLVAATGWLSSEERLEILLNFLKIDPSIKNLILLTMLVLFAITGYYLYTLILDTLYSLNMQRARCEAIEKKINILIGQELLIWDSKISSFLLSINVYGKHLWLKPATLVTFWNLTFFLLTNVVLVLLSCALIQEFWIWYALGVGLMMTFHLQQLFAFIKVGIPYIDQHVFKMSQGEISDDSK